ncbi:prepilin-type N-terminal cleavage/methylation domain-containing protein [Alloiococcus sp. CFN-8]|uniref:prepilin-type N-terminal cleavage/methylation domain-containing protein n=1 Tax=Alloiococcus sp. CFN-8 TaxID=3416081 RepID=UPI003CF39070
MQNVLITNQKKKRKGFTLIELIIVLAVMAIIAAIAIPNLAGVSNNAKKKADIQSCETIKRTALTFVATGDMVEGIYTLTPGTTTTLTQKVGDKTEGVTNTDIVNAFKDVNTPEYGEETLYTIDIDDDGDVTVYTGDDADTEIITE